MEAYMVLLNPFQDFLLNKSIFLINIRKFLCWLIIRYFTSNNAYLDIIYPFFFFKISSFFIIYIRLYIILDAFLLSDSSSSIT